MTKLEKIEQEAQKARERIAAMQTRLKEIDGQRTEQENLQIVQQVRALKLTRAELYAFINGGALPGTLAGMVDGTGADTETATEPAADANPDANPDPEPYYSRHGKNRNRRHEPDGMTEPEGETPDTNESPYTTNNYESEGMNHEEQ